MDSLPWGWNSGSCWQAGAGRSHCMGVRVRTKEHRPRVSHHDLQCDGWRAGSLIEGLVAPVLQHLGNSDESAVRLVVLSVVPFPEAFRVCSFPIVDGSIGDVQIRVPSVCALDQGDDIHVEVPGEVDSDAPWPGAHFSSVGLDLLETPGQPANQWPRLIGSRWERREVEGAADVDVELGTLPQRANGRSVSVGALKERLHESGANESVALQVPSKSRVRRLDAVQLGAGQD